MAMVLMWRTWGVANFHRRDCISESSLRECGMATGVGASPCGAAFGPTECRNGFTDLAVSNTFVPHQISICSSLFVLFGAHRQTAGKVL